MLEFVEAAGSDVLPDGGVEYDCGGGSVVTLDDVVASVVQVPAVASTHPEFFSTAAIVARHDDAMALSTRRLEGGLPGPQAAVARAGSAAGREALLAATKACLEVLERADGHASPSGGAAGDPALDNGSNGLHPVSARAKQLLDATD